MGIPDDEAEVGDSYLCEQCGPEDHRETVQALARGEKIWETRNKIWQNEKKAGQRRKSGKGAKGGWLKKDVLSPEEEGSALEMQETGVKRKREEPEPEQQAIKAEDAEEKPVRGVRQEKRRKSVPPADTDTALVDIDQLPSDRKKIAMALSKIIAEDIQQRAKAGAYRIPDGHTVKSLGDHHAARIEYALTMNHESPSPNYSAQFRQLSFNLKKNKLLIERLLKGSLTADELSTMSSSDMASEELQKERATMKEQLDRQAIAIQEEGPRYRRTHKGDELIEDEYAQMQSDSVQAAPVRERASIAEDEGAGSPPAGADDQGSPMRVDAPPLKVDTKRTSGAGSMHDRRQSSQQFDIDAIWNKTAQSPTAISAGSGPRPLQQPPRRRSSVQQLREQTDGTKEDADVDRMLQDDDENDTYSPADYTGDDSIVWRGKIVQAADSVAPAVNARFVAGRDLSPSLSWRDLLPSSLSIDGRLAVDKAEQYLCSLQWSQSSDVSVLALTPYDDAEGFEQLFTYFKSRQRYAVVNRDKPALVKDLYIIPVDAGEELPTHVGLLEYCKLEGKAREKVLLATFVVGRAPGTPLSTQQISQMDGAPSSNLGPQAGGSGGPANGNGNGQHLPQHLRGGGPGPSGSPLNASGATFSPTNPGMGAVQPMTGYGTGPPPGSQGPPGQQGPSGLQSGGIPPNPYGAPPGLQQQHPNPLVNEILGPLQFAPTAQQVISADPNIPREKLEHLKRIMEEDLNARTDISALAKKLFGES